uniref:Ig-like domain-containing protein n=1 Tax=Salmo trutta TaxID=8032 RepID=A0A674AMM9_SALTR
MMPGVPDEQLYRKVGEFLVLTPDKSTIPDPITCILWKHGLNKAAEWDKDFGLYTYGGFESGTTLDQATGELRISGLMKTVQQHMYPVSQPDFTCKLNGTVATVQCSAKGPLVVYCWSWSDHQEEMWSQEQTRQQYNITSPESDRQLHL